MEFNIVNKTKIRIHDDHMTKEESELIESIKEINETWEIKNKLIKKESRKRIYCFVLVIFFDVSAVILQLFEIINIAGSMSIIIICLIGSLAHNRYIYKKIEKIISKQEDIKELQLMGDE